MKAKALFKTKNDLVQFLNRRDNLATARGGNGFRQFSLKTGTRKPKTGYLQSLNNQLIDGTYG